MKLTTLIRATNLPTIKKICDVKGFANLLPPTIQSCSAP